MKARDLEELHGQIRNERWQYYTLVGFLRAGFFVAVVISFVLAVSWKLPGSSFLFRQCLIPLIVYAGIFLLTWFYLNHRYFIRIDQECKTVYLRKNTRIFFPFPAFKSLFRNW